MTRRLALLGSAILLGLLFGEGLVRGIDPPAIRTLVDLQALASRMEESPAGVLRGIPGARIELSGYSVQFNELGMRDQPLATTAPLAKPRLLILGDSVAFGLGVPAEESLAWRLREKVGAHVDVASAAIPGWNTGDQLKFLAATIDSIAPQMVVLVYVQNDRQVVNPMAAHFTTADHPLVRVNRLLLSHSRLFLLLTRVVLARAAQDPMPPTEDSAGGATSPELAFAPTDAQWLRSRDKLIAINTELQGRGISFRVLAYDLAGRPVDRRMNERLREFANDGGPAHATASSAAGRFVASQLVIALGPDNHPSASGHEVLAEKIAQWIDDI